MLVSPNFSKISFIKSEEAKLFPTNSKADSKIRFINPEVSDNNGAPRTTKFALKSQPLR